MISVLCTSCGNESFPEVVSCLAGSNEFKVIGVDSDNRTAGLWRTGVTHVVPRRAHSEELLYALRELVDKHSVDVILPLSTDDQLFFSAPHVIAALTPARIAITSRQSVAIASDKLATYQALDGLIPLPGYQLADTTSNAAALIARYSERGMPCVLKRPTGTGSQGVKIVKAGRRTYEDTWRVDGTVMHADDLCLELTRWDKTERLMVTDYLPGRHVSVDCIRTHDGSFFAQTREEWSAGHGIGVGGRTINCSEAVDIAKKIADRLDLTFAFNVELKADDAGQLKLLEVNPRMGASVGVSIQSGFNFPLMQVQLALGKELTKPVHTVHIEVRRTVERLYRTVE